MNTETKMQQNDDMELTPQQIQLMQQMQQQNNYTDELKDFASKIASQIESEKNIQQEEPSVIETPIQHSMIDKILLYAKEPLLVSLIIMVLCISNNTLVQQFGIIMPKLVSDDKLSIIGMLLVSILGGVIYYIGKKCFLDKKNII